MLVARFNEGYNLCMRGCVSPVHVPPRPSSAPPELQSDAITQVWLQVIAQNSPVPGIVRDISSEPAIPEETIDDPIRNSKTEISVLTFDDEAKKIIAQIQATLIEQRPGLKECFKNPEIKFPVHIEIKPGSITQDRLPEELSELVKHYQ